MKTLCFAVGLLLLVVCCRDATPTGIHHIAGPEKCCFGFSENPIPLKRVTGIIRTPQHCPHQAFVVSIVPGREFCFRDNFKWAVDTFNKFNTEESS